MENISRSPNHLEMDAIIALGELRTTQTNVGHFDHQLKNAKAKHYFLYGLCRRLLIISHNLEFFIDTIYATRDKPLTFEELNPSILHINSLYIHIYGAIDNIAWTLVYELQLFPINNNIESSNVRRKINLFFKDFIELIKQQNILLAKLLEEQKSWYEIMSEIRHPSAHRVPLYVIPTYLDSDEAKEYQDTYSKGIEELGRLNFDRAGEYFKVTENLGKFIPYFRHDDSTEPFPVYPTITNDCKKLCLLINEIMNFLKCTPRHA